MTSCLLPWAKKHLQKVGLLFKERICSVNKFFSGKEEARFDQRLASGHQHLSEIYHCLSFV